MQRNESLVSYLPTSSIQCCAYIHSYCCFACVFLFFALIMARVSVLVGVLLCAGLCGAVMDKIMIGSCCNDDKYVDI